MEREEEKKFAKFFILFFSQPSHFLMLKKKEYMKALKKKASKTYIHKIHEKGDANITRHIKIIIKENGC